MIPLSNRKFKDMFEGLVTLPSQIIKTEYVLEFSEKFELEYDWSREIEMNFLEQKKVQIALFVSVSDNVLHVLKLEVEPLERSEIALLSLMDSMKAISFSKEHFTSESLIIEMKHWKMKNHLKRVGGIVISENDIYRSKIDTNLADIAFRILER